MFTPHTRSQKLPATTPSGSKIDLDTLGVGGTEPIQTAIAELKDNRYQKVVGPSTTRTFDSADLPAGKYLYLMSWNKADASATDEQKAKQGIVMRADGTVGWEPGAHGPYATWTKIA